MFDISSLTAIISKKEGFPIILIDESIKTQFIKFYKENNLKDMEEAIKYFTVFGGLDIKIDINKPLEELIQKHILNEYTNLRNEVHHLTGGYKIDHAVLSGIAQGDRRTTTAFKRAFVSFEEGMKSVESQTIRGVIETESSQLFIANKRGESKIAKKLLFTTPFLRFWFAFISPIYKGIKEGDFKEFNTLFENKFPEFSDFIFEELSMEYVQDFFEDDKVKQIGKYWDDKCEISIVAKTTSGKILAAKCKYRDSKIKKSDINKLINDCNNTGINADIFLYFAKNGYTNEVKGLKSETLRLFTEKSLKALIS